MALRAGRLSALALLVLTVAGAPLAVRAGGGAPTPQPLVAAASATDAIGARIIELTNDMRKKAGLQTTAPVEYLARAATDHSKEMLDLNYFSHISPTPSLAQPRMRIQQANGWDTRIGENIYRAKGIPADQLADRAVAAWVKSPSHLQNMMDPSFNSIGIGIIPAGNEFIVTQMFSNQTIVIKKLSSTPASGGYQMVFQGQVRDGSKEGAVFVNNTFKEMFQADANGRIEVKAQAPAGAQIAISQKKTGKGYAQNLTFPVEAGLIR